MSKRIRIILLAIVFFIILFVVYLYKNTDSTAENVDKLVVVSPHPTEFVIPLVQEFETETGIKVEIISCGTSAAIQNVINDENIDVLWGGSLLAVGPYKDYFYAYKTPNRDAFIEQYQSVEDEITCFSNVPSVIMVNTDVIGDIKVEGYEDLLQEGLKGQIAFADPSKSSSSFEHLVNMLYAMGGGDPNKGWDYVEQFTNNLDGKLLESSSDVYKGVANGQFKVGLTFEEAAFTMLKNDKHISIIYMSEGVVSTPDGIYISKASSRIENAQKFVDFLTSKDAQRYMASDLGRRSVRIDVDASNLVIPFDDITSIEVDKYLVMTRKESWLESFMAIYGKEQDD